MKYNIRSVCLLCLAAYMLHASTAIAEVYGDGYWEAIGLGNMPCDEFLSKSENAGYKELGAVWLSGFMSGVNFTSSDIYDITWGEDIYVLTELVISRCKLQPGKLLSDMATEIVYKRYQDKNYTSIKDVENK
ncbi:MAG: hypothetical protein O6852_05985 [Gammaproteobacteria bacterium]|nr:hypothetical protein [Gammaproteobacteria bacterium]